MQYNEKEVLWVERYRPSKIQDCVLPERIKNQFLDILKTGHIPNLLLPGGAGVGKTTVAKALCMELGVDWIIINVSDETGIDLFRTKIKEFASTSALSGKGKCIILDEFDYATPNLQAAMRNAMEAFSKSCSFIMTCNFINRVIEPIHSRCVVIPFEFTDKEKPALQLEFFNRILQILDNEGVKYEKNPIIHLVSRFFPDNRRILGQLQQFAKSGCIDAGILNDIKDVSIDKLVESLRKKDFKEVRQWCSENSNNDLSNLYTKLYRSLKDYIEPSSIPTAILILNDYQRYDSVVPDKELHCAAMAAQLMIDLTFKS